MTSVTNFKTLKIQSSKRTQLKLKNWLGNIHKTFTQLLLLLQWVINKLKLFAYRAFCSIKAIISYKALRETFSKVAQCCCCYLLHVFSWFQFPPNCYFLKTDKIVPPTGDICFVISTKDTLSNQSIQLYSYYLFYNVTIFSINTYNMCALYIYS